MHELDLLDYSNLPSGETQCGPCPSCGVRKFYVTRKDNGLAYICFRASCNTQGFLGCRSEKPAGSRPVKTAQYIGETHLPTRSTVTYFAERFGIDLGSVHDASYWVKHTGDGRYAFPIIGRNDENRGVVIRRAEWDGIDAPLRCNIKTAKAMTYLNSADTVRGAWYHSMQEDTVVIVEDQVSAMRIAGLGFTAYALLGTNLNIEQVRDLKLWRAKRYILALDADAIQKAISVARKWGQSFPNFRIAFVPLDPKDYGSDDKLMEDLGL